MAEQRLRAPMRSPLGRAIGLGSAKEGVAKEQLELTKKMAEAMIGLREQTRNGFPARAR